MEKPIRTRTYSNFLKAVKIIMAKGYDHEAASEIVRMQFDNMEYDNQIYGGKRDLRTYLDRIITSEEYNKLYRT